MYFQNITTPVFKSDYLMNMGCAGLVAAIAYFGVGFALVKLQTKKTKLESIFPKKS